MNMSKEFIFFSYLIESYAVYKNMAAADVLKILDAKKLTDFVYDMYEMYHSESINNAFMDIDSLITTGNPAW
jgi:hypothetical protein